MTVYFAPESSIAQFGPVDDLVKKLDSANPRERELAAFELRKVGAALNQEAAHALLKAVKDSDSEVRWNALYALHHLKIDNSKYYDVLRQSLSDPAPRVRLNAAFLISNFEDAVRTALPELVKALRDENKGVRQNAASAFWRLAPKEPEITQALAPLLKDQDSGVRISARMALEKINTEEARKILQDNVE